MDAVEAYAQGGELPGAITSRERVILDHALLLTRAPAQVDEGDVEALRGAGLDDGEILDVNQVTAYYAYANRVADGLGLEVEGYVPVV